MRQPREDDASNMRVAPGGTGRDPRQTRRAGTERGAGHFGRWVAAAVVAIGVLAVSGLPALADGSVSGAGGTITGSGGSSGSGPSSGTTPPSGPTETVPPTDVVAPVAVETSSGQYCYVMESVPPTYAGLPFAATFLATLPPCPPQTPLPTPGSTLATQWSDQAQLPAPSLAVQPGYAVTGLTAYLQITATTTAAYTFGAGSNSISIDCDYTDFHVDWGDGSTTDTRSLGGPYPDGDVNHVYGEVSASDALAVTENWTCRWEDLLGDEGTLDGLYSDSTLPLQVRELEAFNGTG